MIQISFVPDAKYRLIGKPIPVKPERETFQPELFSTNLIFAE